MLRFRDGDRPEVATAATVVWTSHGGDGAPPGMGLRFERLDDKAQELIREIIDSEQHLKTSTG